MTQVQTPRKIESQGERLAGETKPRRSIVRKIGGGITAIGLVAAGVFAGYSLKDRGDSNDKVAAATTEVPSSIDDEIPVNNELSSATSEAGIFINPGNVKIAQIIDGEDFIIANRQNGQEIRVPVGREYDPENPLPFYEEKLAQWACAITTGSEECIRAFSSVPGVQTGVREYREEELSQYLDRNIDSAQISIYDSVNDPVNVEVSSVGNFDTLNFSGSLYMKKNDDRRWQGQETDLYFTNLPTEKFDYFELVVDTSDRFEDVISFRLLTYPTQ